MTPRRADPRLPPAQHFLTTSRPHASAIRDQAGLEQAVRADAQGTR